MNDIVKKVRKASEITSILQLGLSKDAMGYLGKHFSSIDEIVFHGRKLAKDCHQGSYDYKVQSEGELVSALDKNGFVRHDLSYDLFRMNELYQLISPVDIRCTAPASVDEFPIIDEKGNVDYKTANEKYEEIGMPSAYRIEMIRKALKNYLPESYYEAINLRFGLENGVAVRSRRDFARRLKTKPYEAQRLLNNAFAALRRCSSFPHLLDAPKDYEERVDSIIKELDEFYKSPVFYRLAALKYELKEMATHPFEYSTKAENYIMANYGIEKLGLSTRVYHALKGVGINTIEDIIGAPVGLWFKTDGLGSIGRKELVDKVHAAGYDGFDIDCAIECFGFSNRVYSYLKAVGVNKFEDIIKMPTEQWPSKAQNFGSASKKELIDKVRAAGYSDFSI